MKIDLSADTILSIAAASILTSMLLKKKSKPYDVALTINSGYSIVNCKTIVVSDLSKMKKTAYDYGLGFDKTDDGTKLLEKLFHNCYEKLSLTEKNVKHIYTLLFYAMVGANSAGHMTIKQVIDFLKVTIDDFKTKGFNFILLPTENDINIAKNEIKVL